MTKQASFPNSQVWLDSQALGASYQDKHRITGVESVIFPDAQVLARCYEKTRLGHRQETPDNWCNLTGPQALELARFGWSEGAANVGRFDTSHLPLAFEAPVIEHDVSGMFPDIGAFLANEPECMIYVEPKPQPSGLIRVYVNIWIQGTVRQEWITDRARRVARLVLGMIQADLPVEVIAVDPGMVQGRSITCEIPVFKPGWVLNLSQLAYWLGHPGAIRRLYYGWLFGLNNCYGHSIDREASAKLKAYAEKERAIYVDTAFGDGYDLAEAEAEWIKKAKKAQHS